MANLLTIDLDKCFECGGIPIENHHIVPRSRGGKRTIPLCEECHGKAHGISNRDGHSKLTKEGLQRAKENGVKLGTPKNLNETARVKGVILRQENALLDENNIKAGEKIIELRKEGVSFCKITKELNHLNYKTRRGKNFTTTTIKRLFTRFGACEIDFEALKAKSAAVKVTEKVE